MFIHHLKSTSRIILRNKNISVIKVLGLSIGIAAFVLLFEYVTYEKSFDKFHNNSDRIYRITSSYTDAGQEFFKATAPSALGEYLVDNYPHVEKFVAISTNYGPRKVIIKNQDYLTDYQYTGGALCDIFSLNFIEGSGKTLNMPGTAIISKSLATKWFLNGSAIGERIQTETDEVSIIGVFEDFPANAHFRPTFLISIYGGMNRGGTILNQWEYPSYYVYIRTSKPINETDFQKLLNKVSDEKFLPGLKTYYRTVEKAEFHLKNLEDIHLYSLNNEWELEQMGSVEYVNTISLIAILLLIVAAANFINLTMNQSEIRKKGLGIRKILGADKGRVYLYMLIEPVVLIFFSISISVILLELTYANQEILSIDIVNYRLPWTSRLLVYILLYIILVLGTSFFPVLSISKIPSMDLISKRENVSRNKFLSVRNQFVIFQFAVSTFLILGTVIMFKQLRFLSNQSLGFNPEQVIMIKNSTGSYDADRLRDALASSSYILNTGTSNDIPGTQATLINLEIPTSSGNVTKEVMYVAIDDGFVPCLDIKIIQGRNVGPWNKDSTYLDVLVNETFVYQFGLEDPIGVLFKTSATSYGRKLEGRIVGVVKDFHFSNFHEKITPLMLYGFGATQYGYVRTKADNLTQTLTFLENSYKEITGTMDFNYSFLDDHYNAQYKADKERNLLFAYFSIIAIIISSIGLFGISAQFIIMKLKEIGIRKVFGASTNSLTLKYCLRFCFLATVSFLLALPFGYYYIDNWLNSFAYRINIGLGIFFLVFISLLFLAAMTVLFNSYRGASINPVVVLKDE